MASLTEISYYTRNGIKYGAIGIVIYVILRYSLMYGIALYKKLNPPPPPPPSVGFGLLPPLDFPSQDNYDLMFDLQTPNGKFPVFEDRTNVYFMPQLRANLLALDQAKSLASSLGFSVQPEEISTQVYEWRTANPIPIKLEQNIVSGAFEYQYQWQSDKKILIDKSLPGKEQSILLTKQYIEKTGLLQPDIVFDDAQIEYLKASGNKTISAASLSEADFVSINLFRNDINEKQVVTPDPEVGIISFLLSGSIISTKQVIKVDYHYFPVDTTSPETYLLKPIATAWEELTKGYAYLAKMEDEDADTVYIRRISLGYYDNPQGQKFLQPIYIFTGDTGGSQEFVGYVSAIHPDHVKKATK